MKIMPHTEHTNQIAAVLADMSRGVERFRLVVNCDDSFCQPRSSSDRKKNFSFFSADRSRQIRNSAIKMEEKGSRNEVIAEKSFLLFRPLCRESVRIDRHRSVINRRSTDQQMCLACVLAKWSLINCPWGKWEAAEENLCVLFLVCGRCDDLASLLRRRARGTGRAIDQ